MFLRDGVDDGVRKSQPLFQPQCGGFHRKTGIQIHQGSLMHRSHSRESRIFASLPQNDLENFVDTHRGNHEKLSRGVGNADVVGENSPGLLRGCYGVSLVGFTPKRSTGKTRMREPSF